MDAGKVVSLAIYILTALVVVAIFYLITSGVAEFLARNFVAP